MTEPQKWHQSGAETIHYPAQIVTPAKFTKSFGRVLMIKSLITGDHTIARARNENLNYPIQVYIITFVAVSF